MDEKVLTPKQRTLAEKLLPEVKNFYLVGGTALALQIGHRRSLDFDLASRKPIEFGWIFGLFREEPKQYLDRAKQEGLKKSGVSEEEVLKRIEERNAARKEKNWKKADEIRNDLLSKGIVL